MITATDEYKTAIKGEARTVYPLLFCNFNERLTAYPFATGTATSENASYPAQMACNGRIRSSSYETSNIHADLYDAQAGWWSTNVSDGSGDFGSDEELVIQYTEEIVEQNFYIIGTTANYPVDFTISVSTDGISYTTLATVTGNTDVIYTHREDIKRTFTYFKLAISKISAINSACKIIQAGALTTIIFDIYDIDYLKINKELSAKSGSPLGLVSANSAEFSINNEDGFCRWSDSDSIFYKALNRRFRFKPYLGVQKADDKFEFIQCGVFYNQNYKDDTTSMVVSFFGYDEIYKIKEKTPPILAVLANTTIYELFYQLFSGLGYSASEYSISETLDTIIPWGFFPGEVGSNFSGETVGELLQVMSEAGNCNISTDADGVITVKSNFTGNASVETLTDNDFIFSSENVEDFSLYYEGVRIRYKLPQAIGTEELLFETDFEVGAGTGAVLDVEFQDPVGIVTMLKIESTTNVTASSMKFGAVRSQITFANTGTVETVKIKIYGKKLQFFNTSITKYLRDIDAPNDILKISNWLIQSEPQAQNYANSLLNLCSDPANNFNLIERGEPRRELGDVITISDATNNISQDIFVTKYTLNWRSFLSGELQGIKAISDTTDLFYGPIYYDDEPITVSE